MSTCTATTEILEQRCRALLQALRSEIDDLAATVADRVWDRFEAEVRMATEDEFMFETAEMLRMLLASESMTAFQEAYDELLFERFNTLLKELEGSGVKGLDMALLELDGLRKQVWFREFVHEMVSDALEEAKPTIWSTLRTILSGCFRNPDQHEEAKPGVWRSLRTMQGGQFRNPDQTVDSLECDLKEDAVLVRKVLLTCRDALVEKIKDDVRTIVRAAYFSFTNALDSRVAQSTGA